MAEYSPTPCEPRAKAGADVQSGLRPEARPFTRATLTDSQSKVFDRVVTLLQSAVNQVGSSREDLDFAKEFPDRLRPQSSRNNPGIFVSGARGSGKTSLLLTLQREIIVPSKTLEGTVAAAIAELRQRIVWLETLDLEPLPPNTGLMAAIMARIDQAVAEDSESDEFSLRRPKPKTEKAIKDLNDLSLDVCLAWGREYPRLGETIDIDLHAQELLRLEKARISLQSRFSALLDDLASSIAWTRRIINPIFVMPADDIDLNPVRCLDLLRLVRSFQSPRFMVLLFGDYSIARHVVDLSYLKEFGKLLPDHSVGSDKLRLSVDALAFRLGAEATLKMLPPNQSYFLEPNVSLKQALDFPPKDRSGNSIAALLSELDFHFQPIESEPRRSLADWLKGDAPWPAGAGPSAALVLRTSLRKLADFRVGLLDVTRTGADATQLMLAFIERLKSDFQRGVREDGFVARADANTDLSPELDDDVSSSRFKFDFREPNKIELGMRLSNASVLEVCFPAKMTLTPIPGPSPPSVQWSPQTIGRAALLHDLITLNPKAAESPLEIPSVQSLSLVKIHWRVESGRDSCSTTWIAPPLETTWELELFLAHWSRIHSRYFAKNEPVASIDDAEVEPVVTFWLALCGAFAFRSKGLWKIVSDSNGDFGENLGAVAQEYAKQISASPQPSGSRPKNAPDTDSRQTSPLDQRVANWLFNTAVFLTPERYINSKLASAFFDNGALKTYWSQKGVKEHVQKSRISSTTNSNALVAHALLNPREYTSAVRELLNDASRVIEGIGRIFESKRLLPELLKEIGDASEVAGSAPVPARVPAKAPAKRRTKSPQPVPIWGDDSLSKPLDRARNLLLELQASVEKQFPIGAPIRDEVESVDRTLNAVKQSLDIARLSAVHSANTFNGGEICPDLPTKEVTA
jgi:hypothetical protein